MTQKHRESIFYLEILYINCSSAKLRIETIDLWLHIYCVSISVTELTARGWKKAFSFVAFTSFHLFRLLRWHNNTSNLSICSGECENHPGGSAWTTSDPGELRICLEPWRGRNQRHWGEPRLGRWGYKQRTVNPAEIDKMRLDSKETRLIWDSVMNHD